MNLKEILPNLVVVCLYVTWLWVLVVTFIFITAGIFAPTERPSCQPKPAIYLKIQAAPKQTYERSQL